jgi:prephenate dehydrogenase
MGKRVAIIGGAGKMGRWLAGFLKEDGHEVVLADRDEFGLQEAGSQLGLAVTPDNAAAIEGADYVLLSIPSGSFENVVREIGPRVRPGQAVIDISSTKAQPVEIMHRYIKTGIALGVHPLFGPGAANIVNKNFVLTPTNAAETALAEKIKNTWRNTAPGCR